MHRSNLKEHRLSAWRSMASLMSHRRLIVLSLVICLWVSLWSKTARFAEPPRLTRMGRSWESESNMCGTNALSSWQTQRWNQELKSSNEIVKDEGTETAERARAVLLPRPWPKAWSLRGTFGCTPQAAEAAQGCAKGKALRVLYAVLALNCTEQGWIHK